MSDSIMKQVNINLIMFNQINMETQIVSKDKFNQKLYKLYKLFIIKVLKLKQPVIDTLTEPLNHSSCYQII